MKIKLIRRPKFGQDFYWPNCARSEAFCELIGRKSLTSDRLDLIRRMGFDVLIKEDKT